MNSSIWSVSSGDNIYLWGAQLEAGNYVTSYIPTVGATATRSKDFSKRDNTSADLGQKEGTLMVSIASGPEDASNSSNCEILNFNRSTSNSIHFSKQGGLYKVFGYYEPGLSQFYNVNVGSTQNDIKMAATYKNGRYVVFADGVEKFSTSTWVWTPTVALDLSRIHI